MKRILVVLLILTLGHSILQAQEDAIPIDIGQTVEGSLSETQPFAYYTFEADAGTVVSITLVSSDFDAYLVLLDSNGNVIAEDDDSAGRLNAMITTELSDTGVYLINATSLRAYRSEGEFAGVGNYELTLTSDDTTTTLEPIIDISIAYGDVITGNLSGEPINFTFEASSGDVITATLESDEFDTYLFLLDANGVELARNDDFEPFENTNSRIENFVIPEDGTYTLQVNSFGAVVGIDEESGTFNLALMPGVATSSTPVPIPSPTATPPPPMPSPTATPLPPIPSPTMTPLPPTSNTEIAYGDVIEGYLSTNTARFTFNGTAGDIINITLNSSDFDSYLLLYDENGFEIARDDDSGGDLNSRIGPFELAQSGTYTIEVTTYSYISYNETGTGNFVLRLNTAITETIEIGLNEEISDTLSNETPLLVYRVSASAGDVIMLTFDTTSYSVYARLTAAGGTVSQETYGGPGILGPIIVSEDTNYLITVGSYDQYGPYDFTLTINTTNPVAIAYDTPVTTNFDESPAQVFTFEGNAGDIIDVTVDSGGAVDARISLTSPESGTIASDDDSGSGFDPELLNIILPEDGRYAIVAQPYIPGDNGNFTINVANSGVLSIDEAAQVIRVSDKQTRGTVVLEGTAGETVLISARVLARGRDSQPYITVTQNDAILASNPIGDVERLILEFVVPEDGIVQINVEDSYYTGVIIEFSIFNVE